MGWLMSKVWLFAAAAIATAIVLLKAYSIGRNVEQGKQAERNQKAGESAAKVASATKREAIEDLTKELVDKWSKRRS